METYTNDTLQSGGNNVLSGRPTHHHGEMWILSNLNFPNPEKLMGIAHTEKCCSQTENI